MKVNENVRHACKEKFITGHKLIEFQNHIISHKVIHERGGTVLNQTNHTMNSFKIMKESIPKYIGNHNLIPYR